jgi:hypothetical protein
MPEVLDVFSQDAFQMQQLTNAINKIPYKPGRVSELGLFDDSGVTTTSVMIEELNGVLNLVQTSPRGAPPMTTARERRTMRTFRIPHIEKADTIYADSIQNVRAFGQSALETVMNVVERQQKKIKRDVEATIENLRLGALRGQILDADGSVIYDLFSEFGVTQLSEVNFALTTETTDVRAICQTIRRNMAKELGGLGQQRFKIHAFCSDAFFDALISHPTVEKSYVNWQAAAALRDDFVFEQFNHGGITFENYRGTDDGTTVAIAANKAIFFPIIDGLYETYYAPADWMETVNTLGLPMYSKMFKDEQLQKWVGITVQSNPLPLCLIPRVLMKAKKA